jgi:serine/threonine protein kinase
VIGTRLANRYEIVRELGHGGMGVVYLAHDPLLEREVAIKLVPPTSLTKETEERLKQEARLVAKLDHPAIVVVHDIGQHEGSLFFVMPFVGGTNLQTLLHDRTLTLGDVLEIGIQVAEALEYAHDLGIVHRDIPR